MALVETKPPLEVLRLAGVAFIGEELTAKLILEVGSDLIDLELTGFHDLKDKHVEILDGRCRRLENLRLRESASLRSYKLKSLKGLQRLVLFGMKELRVLTAEEEVQLKVLDASKCPHLSTTAFKDFILKAKHLQEVRAHQCISLEDISLQNLPCLEHLDLRLCIRLREVHLSNFPRLRFLELMGCGMLSTLDLADLPTLEQLDVSMLKSLQTLTLSQLPVLLILNICGCDRLSTTGMSLSGVNPEVSIMEAPSMLLHA